ncbi:terminase small subunit-like protein [Sphingosinicella xenopeptidilytica]|uniref:Uncharacterized protein n=1 Tax=Sphingosinicella xenopeptidilytica TaxID=364098 RepID=A0ABW3C2J9_SPHXN
MSVSINDIFDDQIAEVLTRLANGESLRSIGNDARMPKHTTFLLWVSKDPVLAEHYARAREVGMDAIGEEILEIVDSSTPDTAARDRLRYDARRWYLSKLAPKKYGDKLDMTSSDGSMSQPSVIRIVAADDRSKD